MLFLRLVEFMKTKLKEYMAHRLLKLEPDNSAYHTLLSNLKESVGQWGEVEGDSIFLSSRRSKTRNLLTVFISVAIND